ncbi:MAG: hypothetical protein ABIC40_05260 [bacterium]
MATVEELRLKILDRPQVVTDERVGTGDGVKKIYKLRCVPVMADSETIRVGGLVMAGNYELDDSTGKLEFTLAPSDGAAIEAVYDFAAFTDDELQLCLDGAGGNLALAAGEALMVLLTDRTRLVNWSKGDTRIDYDQLRKDLTDAAIRYLKQGRSERGGAAVEDVIWEEVE